VSSDVVRDDLRLPRTRGSYLKTVDAKYDTSENFNFQPGRFHRYIVTHKEAEAFDFCRSGSET
jgi:hypothetical protein